MLKLKEKNSFESPDRLNRIVEGTRIIGDILTESNLRIDGEVEGNVSSSSKVVLGITGRIKGNLNCQDAEIEGNIEGELTVDSLLILRDKSTIVGDIQTGKLQIDEGAYFRGACKMTSGKPQMPPMHDSHDHPASDDIIY